MNDFGMVTEARTVRFERLLPGPIERVWEYLTDSKKRATWLAAGEMDLRVGGKVRFDFKHSNLTTPPEAYPEKYKKYEKGVGFDCRITRIEPPRLLAFTWAGPVESEVTFELTPKGKQVQLVLTHARLSGRDGMVNVSSGWHAHLGVLAQRLEGEVPATFWPVFAKVEAEYEKRIPQG